MSIFEAWGTRGLVLEGAYKALLAIPPTSVESERAFSAAVYLWSKIRCSVAEWQTKPSILYVSCAHIFKIMLEWNSKRIKLLKTLFCVETSFIFNIKVILTSVPKEIFQSRKPGLDKMVRGLSSLIQRFHISFFSTVIEHTGSDVQCAVKIRAGAGVLSS